jgi:SAM-dependent methyltransferase
MLRAWAAHDVEVFNAFISSVKQLSDKPLSELRFLDLGCGANAPVTLLLHASGCRVVGADTHLGFRWGLGFKPARYAAYLGEAGWLKTLRKVAGEVVFDRVYFHHLSQISGLKLTENDLDLRTIDVQRPSLPANAFDVVHSNATWEHIADVGAAYRTVAQSLAPGGLAYIEIHLFPSLSGGHDLPWIVPGKTILGDVEPWQHLRNPNWQAPVFLNRFREQDYRRFLDEVDELEVLDWRVEFTEGQDLVTPRILAELPDYSVDELTKRSIVIVIRKRPVEAGPAMS